MELNNKKTVGETEEFKMFSENFDCNIEFLESFCDLINYSGRIISFISSTNISYVNTNLLDSSVQTLRSIKLCCSIGSFTDANTLIRKLRDDLMLYIYILDVVNKRKPFITEDVENLNLEDHEKFVETFSKLRFNSVLTEDEKAVEAWLNNMVPELSRNLKMKLSFDNYMKFLKQNENVSKILVDYSLENYWEALRYKLNNYVHNNGRQFTSHNLISHDNKQLKIYLDNVNVRASYITTLFLVLIIMVEAALISSGDMIDYLDMGIDPPEGCQYEIANFIQQYIDEKVVKLHPELKGFLNNNNYGMRIN